MEIQDVIWLAREARKTIDSVPDREPDYTGIIDGITAVYDVWIDGNTVYTRRYESGKFYLRRTNLRPGLTLESALVILKNIEAKIEADYHDRHEEEK